MKVAVRYYSKTGNTKKLALAVGEQLNVEALDVSSPLTEKVDVLFLGSSVYAAGVANEVKQFIKDNKENISKIVNFSTAAVLESTYNQISKLAKENNIEIDSCEFHCRGSFTLMHKGRPNEDDLKAVKQFAKKIVQ